MVAVDDWLVVLNEEGALADECRAVGVVEEDIVTGEGILADCRVIRRNPKERFPYQSPGGIDVVHPKLHDTGV